MATRIAIAHGRQIIDSRGNPTVEAGVKFEGGASRRASTGTTRTHFRVKCCLVDGEGFAAKEARAAAEFFLDAQELIVFRNSIGARRRPCFDLPSAHGHDEISDERVFSFARSV